MMVFKAGIHKMIARIANREDSDQIASQKQSDLGLRCFSRLFWQATILRNFRTFTIYWGRCSKDRMFTCLFLPTNDSHSVVIKASHL